MTGGNVSIIVSHMANSQSGKYVIDIEARVPGFESHVFVMARQVDRRGKDAGWKCFVYDEHGNRVIWPAKKD